MPEDRQDNGVRGRRDGAGDGWANAHRDFNRNLLMQDMDAFMGHFAFAKNTADRFFAEYVPDDYANREHRIRDFAVVALFDRKRSEQAAFRSENTVSMAFYLWLTRLIAHGQAGKCPKFFYVCGGDRPPWTMIELRPDTGEEVSKHVLETANWKQVWEACGLFALRKELEQWLR